MGKHDIFRFAAIAFCGVVLVISVFAQEPSTDKTLQPKDAGRSLEDLMVQSARVREPAEKIKLLRQAEALCKDSVQKASEIYPGLVTSYVAIGDLDTAAGLVGEMSTYGAAAIEVGDARVVLARGYLKVKDLKRASEQLQLATTGLEFAINAGSGSRSRLQRALLEAAQLKGELLMQQGETKAALDAFLNCEERRKARKDKPSAGLEFDLARAYAALKRNDEATKHLAAAYSLAAYRVKTIYEHAEVAGAPVLSEYQEELAELEPLLGAIKEKAQLVIQTGSSQESAANWLDRQLAQYELNRIKSGMADAGANRPAPPFALAALNGKTVKLSDLLGKIVLLDFWEPSCKPCRAEYPHLEKIQDEMREAGVVVLMVSLDQDVAQVKPFAEKNGFAQMVLLNNDSVNEKYGVVGIPHNFVIDQKGNIRFSEVGFTLDSPRLFRAEIKALLEQAKSSTK